MSHLQSCVHYYSALTANNCCFVEPFLLKPFCPFCAALSGKSYNNTLSGDLLVHLDLKGSRRRTRRGSVCTQTTTKEATDRSWYYKERWRETLDSLWSMSWEMLFRVRVPLLFLVRVADGLNDPHKRVSKQGNFVILWCLGKKISPWYSTMMHEKDRRGSHLRLYSRITSSCDGKEIRFSCISFLIM